MTGNKSVEIVILVVVLYYNVNNRIIFVIAHHV